MKTKTKLWALFLACMMLIVLLPGSVLAVGSTNVSINGLNLESGRIYKYGEGTVLFDSATNTLVLENATIEEGGDTPVPVLGISGDLTIEIKGNNTITSLEKRPIFIGLYTDGTANVTFKGSGEDKLTIVTNGDALQADGGNITIDGCTVNITSNNWGGISAYELNNSSGLVGGNLTIQNHANVTVNTYTEALYADKVVTISDSNVTLNTFASSLVGANGINVSDSTVAATSTGDKYNALYSAFGTINISNSAVEAYTIYDYSYPAIWGNTVSISNNSNILADSNGDSAIYSVVECNILDSDLKVEGYYDAICSKGAININNGKVEASSNDESACGLYAVNKISISGSPDIIAYGGIDAEEIAITPNAGEKLEVKVGDRANGDAGATHFKDSPYAESVTFTVDDDLWKNTYAHIKPYAHVEEPTLPTCAGDKDKNCDGVVTCDEEKGAGWTWNNTLKVCEYTGGKDYIVVNTSAK